MTRHRNPADPPAPPPGPPFLVGAMIGMTILAMASSAMTLGASLALGTKIKPK